MGRDKANKPRKIGGLKPDVLEALESFPMDPSRALDDPQATSMTLLRVGIDPAVRALRREHEKSGRQGYYKLAFDKGLTVDQAERLEGLVLFLKKLGESITPPSTGE